MLVGAIAGVMMIFVTMVGAATPVGAVMAVTAITTDMLTPVVDQLVQNIAVVMPIGITIFGIMIGIRIIPRIIKSFLG